MIENIQKNKTPLIIGILFTAVLIFLFVAGKNTNESSNMASVVSSDEIEEVVATTTPETVSEAATTTATSTTNEQTGDLDLDDEEQSYTGIGGGDQDILLIDTETSEKEVEENPIVMAGESILAGMDILTDEEFEQLKPNLLELIAALEALIKDLENYIEYLESQ
ncbi:MAG: hypothetical protein KAS07_04045 [Candidatus Pacebacteria bacterium]|nr:hypothetical protein [Candidatus Paceibacterota bacterium]